jgi:3-dehydroquinate synthase
MEYLEQSFLVPFNYRVYFTEDLFNPANPLLADFFSGMAQADEKPRLLIVADQGVVDAMPALTSRIRAYFTGKKVKPVGDILVVPGGEIVKNDDRYVGQIIDAVDRHGIDRHSYVMAIGGGAVLDAVGYAAASVTSGSRRRYCRRTTLGLA